MVVASAEPVPLLSRKHKAADNADGEHEMILDVRQGMKVVVDLLVWVSYFESIRYPGYGNTSVEVACVSCCDFFLECITYSRANSFHHAQLADVSLS